jgi:serine/threonine protein kinase
MPIARAVDVLEQMTAALSHAPTISASSTTTSRATTSCSPCAVVVSDFVKILDFGLAALARDPRLAPKGAMFGTPEYMSPEQARGDDPHASSDLYALGVLFYEMVTGQLPVPLGRSRDAARDAAHRGRAAPAALAHRILQPSTQTRSSRSSSRRIRRSASVTDTISRRS